MPASAMRENPRSEPLFKARSQSDFARRKKSKDDERYSAGLLGESLRRQIIDVAVSGGMTDLINPFFTQRLR
jgi:hypothetical protein